MFIIVNLDFFMKKLPLFLFSVNKFYYLKKGVFISVNLDFFMKNLPLFYFQSISFII